MAEDPTTAGPMPARREAPAGLTGGTPLRPGRGKGSYRGLEGAAANITSGLAQRGIRSNCVTPAPVWTSVMPSTMPDEKVQHFGAEDPMGRPTQPRYLAPVHVRLASDGASHVSCGRPAADTVMARIPHGAVAPHVFQEH